MRHGEHSHRARQGCSHKSEFEEISRGPRFRGGRHGGFGRGPGRVFGPGDLRLVLLSLLGEKPRYGYELIKALEEQFGGEYVPSPGSVYPILSLLEETGLIAPEPSEGQRRRFGITAEGKAFLDANRETVDAVRMRMGMMARSLAGQRPPEAVIQAMHTLKAALFMQRRPWNADEVTRVRSIIERAAGDIEGGERE